VGRPAARIDGYARARGEARYTADVQLPGMLHAAVLRSPHARAYVRRIDLTRALEAPGVHAAIGPDDLNCLTEKPAYAGAPVAAVAADTLGQARAALELIEVEWDERSRGTS
jgi:xanthine dehydrogenase YagR molybdenum-binding subunit